MKATTEQESIGGGELQFSYSAAISYSSSMSPLINLSGTIRLDKHSFVCCKSLFVDAQKE
jgi:hypothetical protein